jgi:Collagen triple helix repeat (20 copies).
MIFREYNFKVDFTENLFLRDRSFVIVQEDNLTIRFNFEFRNFDKETALLKIRHSTLKATYDYVMAVVNNKAELVINNALTMVSGELDMSISYVGENNEMITCSNFITQIPVRPNLGEGQNPPSPEEVGTLVELIREATELINRIERSLANGDFNGKDGRDGVDGINGIDGVDGAEGPRGAIGPQGEPGPTYDDREIWDKVNELSDLVTSANSNLETVINGGA